MKLTPFYLRRLIQEEIEQLLEEEEEYYIAIPADGSAKLYDSRNKEISSLYNAVDWVRDPESLYGTARDEYLHAAALNQFYEKTHPQEKTDQDPKGSPESNIAYNSKEWWERVYGYFKESETSPEEEERFSGHPNISPAMMKSLAGVLSQFKKNIPLEKISFLRAALPLGSSPPAGASFKPILPAPEELRLDPPKPKWASPFRRNKPAPAGSEPPTLPAGKASLYAGGNKAF